MLNYGTPVFRPLDVARFWGLDSLMRAHLFDVSLSSVDF